MCAVHCQPYNMALRLKNHCRALHFMSETDSRLMKTVKEISAIAQYYGVFSLTLQPVKWFIVSIKIYLNDEFM